MGYCNVMLLNVRQKRNLFMTNNKIPQLLTISEASKLLSVHPNTLRNWDEKGILRSVRIGIRKTRRFKKEDILKLLKDGEKP